MKSIILRILASPFVLGLLVITYGYSLLRHWLLFCRYGGEWITYAKDEKVTIKNIYEQLKGSKITSHVETIICPECGTVQEATVKHTIPFPTYIHECRNCKYVIMESEWEKQDSKTKK